MSTPTKLRLPFVYHVGLSIKGDGGDDCEDGVEDSGKDDTDQYQPIPTLTNPYQLISTPTKLRLPFVYHVGLPIEGNGEDSGEDDDDDYDEDSANIIVFLLCQDRHSGHWSPTLL